MSTKKITTHAKPFLILGGSIGFIFSWIVAMGSNLGPEDVFRKATWGCFIGAVAMGSFVWVLNKMLLNLAREKSKRNQEMDDKGNKASGSAGN